MTNEIFISLKPKFAKLIETGEKTYEFRKYRPRRKIGRFWIYVTRPVSELKYVAIVGEPVEYPNKIPEKGMGNAEFNKGMKKSKYAFPILHLDKLIEPLNYKELKAKFKFTPPQTFIYLDNHSSIVEYVVSRTELRRLY